MKNLYAALDVTLGDPRISGGTGQLADLGVRSGGVLLVHSSYRAVRRAAGSIENVIAALAGSLGEEGTLLIPALSFDEVTRARPVFDPVKTVSNIGAIPEFFRRLSATQRSVHPTHSVCGCGAAADEILGSHHLDTTPVGAQSPFRAVRDRGGQILMLGCGLGPMTSMHGVEEVAEAPYIFGYDITYTVRDGGAEYTTSHKHHGFTNLNQRYDRITEILDSPDLRCGQIFGAECWLLEASTLWDKCAEKFERNRTISLKKRLDLQNISTGKRASEAILGGYGSTQRSSPYTLSQRSFISGR